VRAREERERLRIDKVLLLPPQESEEGKEKGDGNDEEKRSDDNAQNSSSTRTGGAGSISFGRISTPRGKRTLKVVVSCIEIEWWTTTEKVWDLS